MSLFDLLRALRVKYKLAIARKEDRKSYIKYFLRVQVEILKIKAQSRKSLSITLDESVKFFLVYFLDRSVILHYYYSVVQLNEWVGMRCYSINKHLLRMVRDVNGSVMVQGGVIANVL